MKDRLISAVLALQVGLSLVLTGVLWNKPQPLGWAYEQTRVTALPDPISAPLPDPRDALRPVLVWARMGTGGYVGWDGNAFMQATLWRQATELLAEGLDAARSVQFTFISSDTVAPGDFLLGMDLPTPLNLKDWAQLWGGERFREDTGEVDRVVLSLTPPGTAFFIGPDSMYRMASLPFAGRQRLLQILQSINPAQFVRYRALGEDPTGGSPPEEKAAPAAPAPAAPGPAAAPEAPTANTGSDPGLARSAIAGIAATPQFSSAPAQSNPVQQAAFRRLEPWVLVPESPELSLLVAEGRRLGAEALLPRFFPDVTVVREIEERDGAAIFTDGQRALRLYASGELEFRAPADTTAVIPELRTTPIAAELLISALKTVQEFASRHTRWPLGAVLTQYEWDAYGQLRLYFSLRNGILQWPMGRPPLEVHLANGRVSYLFQVPETETSPVLGRPLVSPEVAAQLATVVSPQGGDIRWVRYGHVGGLRAGGSNPVWSLGFSRRSPILLDARTGRILP